MLDRRTIAVIGIRGIFKGRICASASPVEVRSRCGGCISTEPIAHAQLVRGAACCVFAFRHGSEIARCGLGQSWIAGLVIALHHCGLSVVGIPGVESGSGVEAGIVLDAGFRGRQLRSVTDII